MLHLIPAPLHRALYRVANRARRIWWRIRKPQRASVQVVAFDERGRVLLVRHSYGAPVWALPGGGMGLNEDPLHAAGREIAEEVGCTLAETVLVGAREVEDSGSRDLRHLVAARLVGVPAPDMRELVAVGLFAPAELPSPLDRRVRLAIAEAEARRSKQR